jgi:hypothetical protein
MIPRKSREDTTDRRYFIGAFDARVVMGQNEKAMIRLWQDCPSIAKLGAVYVSFALRRP